MASLRTSSPIAAVLGVFVLSGCASQIRVYTPDELRSELDERVSVQMRDEVVIPFEIDDEIRELAREVTRGANSEDEKVRAIVRAIVSRAGFSLSYDWLSNKTAQEVFREGRGNCLAYSNLFVGMARSVGIDARYADVTFKETLTREAEVLVHSGHITAAVKQPEGMVLIDFTSTPERRYVGSRVIDDLEAIASFYNNQGFLYGYYTENVDFDPLEKELEMYNLALEVYPTLAAARNNLGVALRRRGKLDEAIEQYMLAIEAAPRSAGPYSNLSRVYLEQGRTEDALEIAKLGARRAGKHGFIYHHLGVVYMRLERYEEAAAQFRKAISKEPELADARFLLGECYRLLGRDEEAAEQFQATLEIDPNFVAARVRLDRLTPPPQLPR